MTDGRNCFVLMCDAMQSYQLGTSGAEEDPKKPSAMELQSFVFSVRHAIQTKSDCGRCTIRYRRCKNNFTESVSAWRCWKMPSNNIITLMWTATRSKFPRQPTPRGGDKFAFLFK